ncbi:hypothetical protein FGIG_09562 [Fasciola gigantica]|uniref:Uncharacterized protein n=1 Tax=Fasciola gigantica TaxID=46835 RepID=A0A504YGD3_FASGI|nr:hypothetical protein FGIG_09562 [Fasciola gigantica]
MALCLRSKLWQLRDPREQTFHLFLHWTSGDHAIQVRLNRCVSASVMSSSPVKPGPFPRRIRSFFAPSCHLCCWFHLAGRRPDTYLLTHAQTIYFL